MAIITDLSIVELEMEIEWPRTDFRVRYMAPELLNPSQFHLKNSNPTKESDIYSLALTVYEVFSPRTAHGRRRRCLCRRFSHKFSHMGTLVKVSSSSKLSPGIGRPVLRMLNGYETRYGTWSPNAGVNNENSDWTYEAYIISFLSQAFGISWRISEVMNVLLKW